MAARVAEQSVKCSFHLTNRSLWFLEAIADKLTKQTGGVIKVTRTEVIEMAIREKARAEGIQ